MDRRRVREEDGVRERVAREVEEELAFHLEMRVRELVEKGWDEEEARAEAERRLGDLDEVRARMRREGERREVVMGRRAWWDEIGQDLRYGWRQLRSAPGFAAVAVLTLGLAIGANSAVFTVVNGVLLKPLPYEEPGELAMVLTRYLPESGFDIPRFALSGPELLDFREETEVFEEVGAFLQGGSRALTGEGEEAVRIPVTFVADEILPMLGVPPHLGRWFTAEEDVPDGPAVTLLSHDLWTSRFGADPGVVGRTVPMNGMPTEIVGVMPPGFEFGGAQAWLPVGLDRSNQGGRAGHGYAALARLAPGRTHADAQAELAVVRERWAAEHEHNVGHFVIAEPLEEAVLADAPRTLALLLAAVGLVLLVACVNVANLLLARGERRSAEVAVRVALGAGRGRILRQLVTESALLAGLAGVVGLGLAWVGTPVLVEMAPTALPRLEEARPDGAVLAFTLAVALLTVGLFGVLPSALAARRAVARAASAAARTVQGGAGRLRRTLVVGEVALSLLVVLTAGLLARSYLKLDAQDRGMETGNLLTFSLTLPTSAYPDDARAPEEMEGLLERIRAVPGVAAATAGNRLPFADGYGQWDFRLDDRPPRADGEQAWNAAVHIVGPRYFETLGIPLTRGRGIRAEDDQASPWVGVVSEHFVRTYWPGQDPLGKRWGYQQAEDSITWITVVGVAADPYLTELDEEPYPQVWIPASQAGLSGYGWPRTMRIAVRTGIEPGELAPAVRRAVAEFDPDLPVYELATMEDVVAEKLARPRLTTSLLGLFGLLALLLAAVGIYGVVAYSVAGRTREIGVRLALGASRGKVLGMVVREGVAPVLLGVALGLAAAWAGAGLVEALLFGVEPTDPLTFAVIPALLVAVGLLACWLPARRATRVPPTEALRGE